MTTDELEKRVRDLTVDLARLRLAVSSLVIWIGSSAASPLSGNECRRLIDMIEGNRHDKSGRETPV